MRASGINQLSHVANSIGFHNNQLTPCKPVANSRAHAHPVGPRIQHLLSVRCHTAALEREAIRAEARVDEHVSRETLPAPSPGQLQHNATLFVEEHRIRAYEVDADQKTTISTVANLLQVVQLGACCTLAPG